MISDLFFAGDCDVAASAELRSQDAGSGSNKAEAFTKIAQPTSPCPMMRRETVHALPACIFVTLQTVVPL